MNFDDLNEEQKKAWDAVWSRQRRRERVFEAEFSPFTSLRDSAPHRAWESPFDSPAQSVERARREYLSGRIELDEFETSLDRAYGLTTSETSATLQL